VGKRLTTRHPRSEIVWGGCHHTRTLSQDRPTREDQAIPRIAACAKVRHRPARCDPEETGRPEGETCSASGNKRPAATNGHTLLKVVADGTRLWGGRSDATRSGGSRFISFFDACPSLMRLGPNSNNERNQIRPRESHVPQPLRGLPEYSTAIGLGRIASAPCRKRFRLGGVEQEVNHASLPPTPGG